MNLGNIATRLARGVDFVIPWPRIRELEETAQRLALRIVEQQRFIEDRQRLIDTITIRMNQALDDQQRMCARADRLTDAESYIGELETLLVRATREIRDQNQRDAITADVRAAKRYWLERQTGPITEPAGG